jgi:hypothetical protein
VRANAAVRSDIADCDSNDEKPIRSVGESVDILSGDHERARGFTRLARSVMESRKWLFDGQSTWHGAMITDARVLRSCLGRKETAIYAAKSDGTPQARSSRSASLQGGELSDGAFSMRTLG